MDITKGISSLDTKDLVRLLASLEEKPLTKDSNLYDIGYSACQRDILRIVATGIKRPDIAIQPVTELVKQLRKVDK